ncbi:tRNA lysidine(34) synthetase TilS, partial [Desulfovibrio oxamicus]
RPESTGEARAVAALCRRLGVPCRMTRADVAERAMRENCGLEDAGRRARYAFFEAERQRIGADWICTAHQSDDLCEDVLLRLVRGTGWPGLGGMAAMDPARRILRPLLTTERRDIDAFLADLGVLPVRDPSNADPAYRRNRLRHQVLPLLRAENPALGEAVRTLWELARCDADYWTCHLAHAQAIHHDGDRMDDAPTLPAATCGASCTGPSSMAAAATPQRILLPGRTLRGLHRAARLRLYKRMLDRLGPGQPLAASLMDLDAAWHSGRGRACVQFPGGKTARVVSLTDGDGKCEEGGGGIEFRASATLPS